MTALNRCLLIAGTLQHPGETTLRAASVSTKNRKRDALAAPARRDGASSDLVLVGGESSQDFGLLTLRDFGEIQRPSEFCCDFVEFCWRNLKVPVGLLEPERRLTGLSGRELEGSTRCVTNP